MLVAAEADWADDGVWGVWGGHEGKRRWVEKAPDSCAYIGMIGLSCH